MLYNNNNQINSCYYTLSELYEKKHILSKSDWLRWLDSLTIFEVLYISGILVYDTEVNAILMKKFREEF